MSARLIMKLLVTEISAPSHDVKLITLRHPKRPMLPTGSAGAHVDVRLPDGKTRQYSLCGDVSDASFYRIAVKRVSNGRGGSMWLHEKLDIGSILHVSAPRNNFGLAPLATRHIFIAGGIGITPFVSLAQEAAMRNQDFLLFYFAKSAALAPLIGSLSRIYGPNRFIPVFSDGTTTPLTVNEALLGASDGSTHLYCCGPQRLVDAVRDASAKWPDGTVHFEAFAATLDENFKPEPFDITIRSTGEVIRVPADRSALEILHEKGWIIPSSCELGVCGSCVCTFVSGTVIHRDVVLNVAERQDRMMLCVSRARVAVTLDL